MVQSYRVANEAQESSDIEGEEILDEELIPAGGPEVPSIIGQAAETAAPAAVQSPLNPSIAFANPLFVCALQQQLPLIAPATIAEQVFAIPPIESIAILAEAMHAAHCIHPIPGATAVGAAEGGRNIPIQSGTLSAAFGSAVI